MAETTAPGEGSIRDQEAVSYFIERFAQMFTDAGMPRVASRILVTLVATDSGRLTAGELAEQLCASPAAISGGVRYLIHVGLATRGREPGCRRDYYQVDKNVWYQSMVQRDRLLARWAAYLREGAEVLGEHTPAGARLADSVEFFDFLQRELRLVLERWHASRGRPGTTGSL